MNTAARYAILVVFLLIGLHSILRVTHEQYGHATSLTELKIRLGVGNAHPAPVAPNVPTTTPAVAPAFDIGAPSSTSSGASAPSMRPGMDGRRANATLLMLARNSDLDNAVRSVRRLEDRFNRHFNYPWMFLNEEPFDDEFKRRISLLTRANVTYALIPRAHWIQADWIDEERANASRTKMEEEGVIYGGSLPYRNMCRYNSGFFFKHPLLQQYRWYWRVEPDVHYHCDVKFDPFLFMEDFNKTYSFTITLYEFQSTIATLWDTTKDFMRTHPQYFARDNALNFVSDDGGDSYNLCHFWSNFEIADMDFFRGEAYQAYFDYLDSKGGFYYERWGDAPVHSIAAALFLPKDRIHIFDEIGYEHNPNSHCPRSERAWQRGRCACDRGSSFDYSGYSCMNKWDAVAGR